MTDVDLKIQLKKEIRQRGVAVLELESYAWAADDALAGRKITRLPYGALLHAPIEFFFRYIRVRLRLAKIYRKTYKLWRKAHKTGSLGGLADELRPKLEHWMSNDEVFKQRFESSTVCKFVLDNHLSPQDAVELPWRRSSYQLDFGVAGVIQDVIVYAMSVLVLIALIAAIFGLSNG